MATVVFPMKITSEEALHMDVASSQKALPLNITANVVAGGGSVYSVNGKTGDVVLTAEDVGAATAEQGMPLGGNQGDILINSGNDIVVWVAPANTAEQDNTRPITSAAVYTEIGNINALLATI